MFDGIQTEFGSDLRQSGQPHGSVPAVADPLDFLINLEGRLAQFEDMIATQLQRVQNRLATLEGDVEGLQGTDTGEIVKIERQLVALMDRINRLEETVL